MALDVGARKIGVALTDPLKAMARPLTTLRRQGVSSDARRILDLARDNQVEKLILGLPRRLDGSEGSALTVARRLAREISAHSSIAIEWCDERLSSKEAEQLMADARVPIRDRRGRRDEFAAAIILKRYLEEGAD